MSMPVSLDDALRERLSQVSVPTIVSTLYRKGYPETLMRGPRPVSATTTRMIGTAVTLRTIPVRADLLEAQNAGRRPNLQAGSVEALRAGDVLVVDMGGETRTAFMGDVMTTYMWRKGVAGIVLDGSVNDAASIRDIPVPVFAAGDAATPLTSHRIAVEMNGEIGCGGVTVVAGDVIVSDANGVCVIPRALAEEIAEIGVERELLESFVVEKVRAGAPLAGTYPPNEATKAEFEIWRRDKGL